MCLALAKLNAFGEKKKRLYQIQKRGCNYFRDKFEKQTSKIPPLSTKAFSRGRGKACVFISSDFYLRNDEIISN
jgi:hypothetical protein